MNNPARRAMELLHSMGYSEPSDLSIEEIAYACGFIVQNKAMDGSEGRILMTNSDVLITINSSITYQPKINYILSHEIGHAMLHRNIIPIFNDNHKTLSEWFTKGVHETEANQFAVELLMPSNLFSRKVKNKKLTLQLIEEIADYFNASKTATFLRYRDLGEYPLMIIFIEDGIIKWKSHSNDFPFQWLSLQNKVPVYTVAGDLYYNQIQETQPAKVKAMEWFPEDYRLINGDQNTQIWEQCFPSTANSIVTCLWLS